MQSTACATRRCVLSVNLAACCQALWLSGTEHSPTAVEHSTSGFIHAVTATGLQPSTTYYYVVGSAPSLLCVSSTCSVSESFSSGTAYSTLIFVHLLHLQPSICRDL